MKLAKHHIALGDCSSMNPDQNFMICWYGFTYLLELENFWGARFFFTIAFISYKPF